MGKACLQSMAVSMSVTSKWITALKTVPVPTWIAEELDLVFHNGRLRMRNGNKEPHLRKMGLNGRANIAEFQRNLGSVKACHLGNRAEDSLVDDSTGQAPIVSRFLEACQLHRMSFVSTLSAHGTFLAFVGPLEVFANVTGRTPDRPPTLRNFLLPTHDVSLGGGGWWASRDLEMAQQERK